MKLYPVLLSFVDYVKTQEHIEPLLPQHEQIIGFQFEEEYCTLLLSRNKILLSQNEQGLHKETITFIKEADLRQCIAGAVRLQPLLRRKGAEYKGTYRTLLLLESLFHICKPFKIGA